MDRQEYLAYLRSPEWQQVRLHAWRQAVGRCESCFEEVGTRFEVHHKSYQFLGRELVAPETIECLCPKCHRERHGK